MFSVRCVHQYDLRNRLTLSCGARGSCTGYQYDPDDNLTQATSGAGTVTQYHYDNLNRRSEIDYGVVSGNPTSKVTLTCDLGDRLTQAADSNSNGTVTRQYGSEFDLANGWDFVTKETTSQGSVSYGEPDAAGRRTTMTVTAGTTAEPTVTFGFDDAGKLTSVTRSGLTATKTFNDPAGRLKTLKLPNNLAVTYGYNRDSHVTSLSYGSLGTLTYGYDADGRRVSVSGSLASLPAPQPTQSFSFNPDNSLKTVGASAVTNDNDGDILCITGNICSPGNEFSYDELGHLQQWVANPYTVDYSYDALGRRYEKNGGGLTASCYVYDGLNVAATTACYPAGTIYSYLTGTGLDELFLVNDGSSNESFLRDPLDSTIALTDSSGTTILDQTTYDAYGNTTDSVPLQASPFEFTGRENDTTSISTGYYYSNLYFMRSRYYDPQLARFISRDPAGLAGGTNMYTYAGDDPVDFSDPMGTNFESALEGPGDVCSGCIGGFVGAYVSQGLAPLANMPGRDNDVPWFYDGSQNGGGLRDIEEVQFNHFYGRATLYDCCNATTSTGDPFNPNKISSAAMPRSLVPRRNLPVFVIVRDLDDPTTKPIVVKTNDVGGPALRGDRIIDLTPAAFRALGLNPKRITSFNAEVDVPLQ
jgi:RHS repeat-associated protein